MTFNQTGGMVNSAAFATDQLDELLTLSVGNYLTRFTMDGIQNSDAVSGAIATSSFLTDTLVGGLQYGSHGYGGTHLTAGNTSGASWIAWGNVTLGFGRAEYLAGLAPQNATVIEARVVRLDWHGLFRATSAIDLYGAFGTQPGHTFSFGMNYRWYAEWAS